MSEGKMSESRIAALVGVMAAVYYVFLWLPNIPAVGVPEVKIDIGASFAPILGLLLGPYLGFAAALLGDILKFMSTPSPFSLPFLLCPPVSALSAGYLSRGRWKEPLVLLAVLLLAAMFTPVFFPIHENLTVYVLTFFDKITALLLIPVVSLLSRREGKPYIHAALLVTMFIGNEIDATLGNFVFSFPQVYSGIFGAPDVETVRGWFTLSPLLYPTIRVLQAVLGYVIAVPLLKILSRVKTLGEFLPIKDVKLMP